MVANVAAQIVESTFQQQVERRFNGSYNFKRFFFIVIASIKRAFYSLSLLNRIDFGKMRLPKSNPFSYFSSENLT